MPNQCGKSCETCAVREEIHCGGCQHVIDHHGCEIAQCASKNNHATCETCIMRRTCPSKRNAFSMHKLRAEQNAAEEERMIRRKTHASVLEKWLNLLFKLMIADLIISLLDGGNMTENLPAVSVGAAIVSFVLNLAQIFCIWQLRNVHTSYKKSAVCQLISAGLTVIADILPPLVGTLSQTAAAAAVLLISLPGTVLSIYAIYLLYNAHSWVTADVDRGLSEKWENLWKWQIILLIGTLCSPILALFGMIGALAVLACLIGIIIIGILELVYLHRTANLFRYLSD